MALHIPLDQKEPRDFVIKAELKVLPYFKQLSEFVVDEKIYGVIFLGGGGSMLPLSPYRMQLDSLLSGPEQ